MPPPRRHRERNPVLSFEKEWLVEDHAAYGVLRASIALLLADQRRKIGEALGSVLFTERVPRHGERELGIMEIETAPGDGIFR